ncbi:MAG: hypothetical protein HOV78_11390 [Hamadaea sp.]|nr:hypothetical protein [Hamadaea sp.]
MTDQTYTNRWLEASTVQSLDNGVLFIGGWGFGASDEQKEMLAVHDTYLVEHDRTMRITGMATIKQAPNGLLVDEWLWHMSDQDLEREHEEFVARMRRRSEETLAANRENWTRREAALPDALRRRLERFRANGGDDFDREGWGYELVVCELAAMYAASGQTDSDEINDYARREGTSGNQHDYAKALSRHLTDDPAEQDLIANSVSALSPITGDADYSKAGDR